MKKLLCPSLFFILVFYGCDKGIAPEELAVQPGFSGKIIFRGEWAAGITRTHIVLFKDPLQSASDFNINNLKYVSEEIPYGSEEYSYNTLKDAVIENIDPGEYAYLAVAQSRSIFLSLNRSSWFVVGIYINIVDSTNNGKIIIPSDQFLVNINITCNFDNPPVQPPGI